MKHEPEYCFFDSEADWIAQTTAEIFSALPKNERAILGVSGGSTPKLLYRHVAEHWPEHQRAQVVLVDERVVSEDDPQANVALIRETFVSKIEDKQRAQVDFLYPHFSGDIERDVDAYGLALSALERPFDVCVLGVGPDGHIASLFPGDLLLMETKKLAVHTTTEVFAVRDRVSVTLPVLFAAKKIILFLSSEKMSVVEELRYGALPPHVYPAKYLLEHPNLRIHVLAP